MDTKKLKRMKLYPIEVDVGDGEFFLRKLDFHVKIENN